MRFKWKDVDLLDDKRSRWHRWFAVIPIAMTSNTVVWLEFVERKGTYRGDQLGGHWEWEYRFINTQERTT